MSHVALVIPGLDRIGGAERQVMLLAKGLIRRGWWVTVVALSGTGGSAAAELTAAGVGFCTLGMRKGLADPRGWLSFRRWLREESPEVVHAHLPHAAWMARWSRLGVPIRVVVDTLHSSSTGTLGRRLGYRCSDWLSDKVTAVSQAVAASHVSAAMVNERKLIVLSNGVDVGVWKPDDAAREGMRSELCLAGEFLWFAAGRLEAVKDYPTLLRAMAEVPQSARLVIAGAGPLENELRRLSSELGLEHRVNFLGFEPNVRRWMQAADGFVLSSLWEGLPMGLLEAAACALPAVATDVPGTREIVHHEQTGILAPVSNPAALAEVMACMMHTPSEERKAMGERARELAVAQCSLEAVLNQWETLYRDLLQQNPVPRRWSQH